MYYDRVPIISRSTPEAFIFPLLEEDERSMDTIEYRLYRTDKNSYISLLIESVYLDGSPYFIYTRLKFIWKKTLTRGIVRYLLGLDPDSKTGGINYNFIISRCPYKSDYYFFEWLFKKGFSEINLIRREEICI